VEELANCGSSWEESWRVLGAGGTGGMLLPFGCGVVRRPGRKEDRLDSRDCCCCCGCLCMAWFSGGGLAIPVPPCDLDSWAFKKRTSSS